MVLAQKTKTVNLSINGQQVQTKEGSTVLEAAREAGIYIPTLCYHPNLTPYGGCRMCIVEIENLRGFPTSCTTPVTEGMVVQTNTTQLQELRRNIFELILAEHPFQCLTCPKNLRCELQEVATHIGVEQISLTPIYRDLPILSDSPFFDRDYNLCILCGRCVRVCQEVRGVGAIALTHRGSQATVGTAFGESLQDSGCKFCLACVEVCPTAALIDKEAKYHPIPDWEAYVVPCRHACPAHIDIPRYINLIVEGKHSEALAVIREKVPFPGVLGRVCEHPCEEACRRTELNDPICIKFLKRFVHDYDNGLWKQNSKVAPSTGRKVAIVGSGPAGLTTAYYVAKQGHSVVVFEALPQTGGMLRVGIPAYRLPREILDAEIKEIESIGVDIKTNTRITSLDNLLEQGYEAIFLGLGAHKGIAVYIEGENSPNVIEGVDLLRRVNLNEKVEIGGKVAVIGGGNVAIDCARTALRIGAKEVFIIYRRTKEEMPAAPEEIEEALNEGIEIIFLVAPSKLRQKGRCVELECIRMKLGDPDASGRRRPIPIEKSEFVMQFDNVIKNIGQTPEIPSQFKIEIGKGNVIEVNDETMATSRQGVFAGGDVATGPASVIGAIAHGRQAAISIDKYLGGNGVIDESLATIDKPTGYLGKDDGFAYRKQVTMPCLDISQRLATFAEVECSYDEATAIEEAKRCLRCDLRLQITSPIPSRSKAKSNSGSKMTFH